MERQPTVVILNPRARRGRTGRRAGRILDALGSALGPCALRQTRGPLHAAELATQARDQGAERIIAVGGDGTLSEVVNGLLAEDRALPPRLCLGLLSSGTGGDFARSLGLPSGLAAQLRVLADGEARPVDVGEVSFIGHDGRPDRRYFINSASFGMSGRVCSAVNRAGVSKRLGGTAAFYLASLSALIGHRNQRVRLGLDGQPAVEGRANTVVVANGSYLGGGMHMAPAAAIDDGWLDVVTIGDLGLVDFLVSMPRLYRGTHLDHPKVQWRRARHVRIACVDPDDALLIETDGEHPGTGPAEVRILPRALRILAPP